MKKNKINKESKNSKTAHDKGVNSTDLLAQDPEITIILRPLFNGNPLVAEAYDPTPLIMKFINSMNTIPPRMLKDYGPVFPIFKGDNMPVTLAIPNEGIIEVTTNLTLVYNAP